MTPRPSISPQATMSTVRETDKKNSDTISRPTLQSQLSSSVPSTPFQEPRRFHSRSPSPRRALGNHSPRSVVSEAVEPTIPNGIPRAHTGPVVCKFETAPEWRKRRIPYIDGGDQDLAPPEKRPKSELEPAEEDKLSGDMRELYDRLLPSDESESRRAELVRKLDRILNEEWPGHEIKVSVFGSSGNLLSSSDSDVDICVTTTLKKVESMHTLAALLNKHGMERVVCRAAAKVPIVKCWDPVLELACDVNVNNPLALENTRMIKTYVQLDSRVRPLAKIIKYWTKQRILNDAAFGGTISSYTWICMIISFLQQREPPILPSLQKIPNVNRSCPDGKESEFADDLEALKDFGTANKESLASLLFNFFRYYGYEFEYSKLVVSVKEGRKLSREEKGWDNYKENKEARCRLCVEEPFNTSRNLGNSADDYAWSGIHGEIRRAFQLLADGAQLEKCCEAYEFPPEERSIFQRPVARPKPTLTRSASQSGSSSRSNHDPTRSRKGSNRNQSSHRSGNRRASSGSVFNNQRASMLQSPQLGISSYDYFAKQGLHEQLFQQYQYLQAQQDALRTQLVLREQQQQQQGQAPSPHLNATNSPQPRQGSFANRLDQHPPQSAPLLPGSPLYHFSARYPPQQSPSLSQTQKVKDGSSTNPSSPSMVHSVPALLRQGNRTSLAEGSSSAIRSQSQPGRSLPHPIALQQQVHPGYDVSGAYNGRNTQYPPVLPGYPFSIGPMAYHNGIQVDPALPKEYVGYYVGQSPQLGPQYSGPNQMHVPPMSNLRDPPASRQRRVTPDLAPPTTNGQQNSRSPSPLGHVGSPSLAEETAVPPPAILDPGAPIIVNGSTPSVKRAPVNGNHRHINDENALGLDLSASQPLPIRSSRDRMQESDVLAERERSASVTKNLSRTSPHLNLSPTGTPPNGIDTANLGHESAVAAIPLLSPVAELRTPSPTYPNRFELKEWQSQISMNGIDKSMKGVHAKTAELENAEPKSSDKRKAAATLSIQTDAKHERKGSAPNPTTEATKSSKSPTSNLAMPLSAGHPTAAIAQDKNPWQQATGRKGHKKSKSIAQSLNMQQSSVIEGERKGG